MHSCTFIFYELTKFALGLTSLLVYTMAVI